MADRIICFKESRLVAMRTEDLIEEIASFVHDHSGLPPASRSPRRIAAAIRKEFSRKRQPAATKKLSPRVKRRRKRSV